MPPDLTYRVGPRTAFVLALLPLFASACNGETPGETAGETTGETSGATDPTTGTDTDTGEGTTDTESTTTETTTDGATGTDTADDDTTDTGDTGDTSDTGDTDTGELVARISAPSYVTVGEPFTLAAEISPGATGYSWNFGNGATAPISPSPTVTFTYVKAGRYTVRLTVYGTGNAQKTAQAAVSATAAPTFAPQSASSVAVSPLDKIGNQWVAVVSPDSDELAVNRFNPAINSPFGTAQHIDVCDGPRTVAWRASVGQGDATGAQWAVACENSDEVVLVSHDGGLTTPQVERYPMPRGSRPFGVLAHESRVFVTLQATGQIAILETLDTGALPRTRFIDALPDVRALALLPGAPTRLATARFRSPDERAELLAITLDEAASPTTSTPFSLRFDPQEASDTEIGGVPNYLHQIAVSPLADEAVVASLQDNIDHGRFVNGEDFRNDLVLRATASFFDPASLVESFTDRKQFDNRGMLAAAIYAPRGDYVYFTDRGTRTVERYDTLTRSQAGTILDVGYAPQGLALDATGQFLFVDAYLSRELRAYDVSSFAAQPEPVGVFATVSSEPLPETLLIGKRLFNDSFDPRLAGDNYLACAQCHYEGETDNRTWDFTDRGEGLRNTTSLLGRAGMGHGPVHWSANFDEIQDFENDIRGHFGGRGLLTNEQFETGTRSDPLGEPKAGLNSELDALAAYVASLTTYRKSPLRGADGSLSASAQRGQALFENPALGCVTCHTGPALTDSRWLSPGVPNLHDVGTLDAGSGQRRGATLAGIDTPTLYDLWATAPYLHHGQAATVRDVLTVYNTDDQHGVTSTLSDTELDDLVAYLLSLE
jgi:mono/diheme cytochrome c family protein